MTQVNQLLKDLSRHSDLVKKCASPLHHLYITCFYYVNIKNNGDYFLLTDCPEVDEYYFDEKLYLNDPYIRHPSNYQSGFFIFQQNQKEDFDQSLAYLAKNFRMTPLIGFCERHKDSMELYGFWSKSDRPQLTTQNYLSYSNLLREYTKHFKEEFKEILAGDTVPYLSLTNLIGNEFISSMINKNESNVESICAYLNGIGYGNYVKKANMLSKREKECIKLLLKGKSSKESGKLLALSSRTIESYFESIKNKFCCHYKSDIFDISEKLNEWGLL